MKQEYKVHILIDGQWTYPMCYRQDNEYYNSTTHQRINKDNIHNVE